MGDESGILQDPEFKRLLTRRSRWRWGLSGSLISAYLLWAVGGVYFAEAYATPITGMALTWGLAMGFLLIAMSIFLSIFYVRLVNQLETEQTLLLEKQR